jgi:metal-sulfur cluster biosynthetic enzyme
MNKLQDKVIEKLKTVYDPEFPMVDIYTLGLIYDVKIHKEKNEIYVLISFTTPACPMAETIQEMIKNALLEIAPEYTVNLEITFDPMRSPSMIRDEDLKRMFE